jgi:hypothetical protein|tara:strand:- start:1053 stop:1322 length:270 start_codon:yes stop_codon:yes gene_type:complete
MATESFHKRSGYVLVIIRITVPGRLLPSEDPIAESVLEWTIMRDSRDIRQLMVWMEESEGRKERSIFMNRALDLMDEIQYALSRLDELR